MLNTNYNGIIEDPRPLEEKLNDYVLGGETGIVHDIRFPDMNCEAYLPKGERQYLQGKYDTMNCTNFSSGHSIETQIIYLWKNGKLSQEAQTFFKQYLKDENDISSFRVSKRAAGILSGTTKQGNWFAKVWDTWRKVGIIPDSMLPFENCNTWEEYMNPNLITQEMRDIGQESLKYIQIQYEVLQGYDRNGGFSELEIKNSQEALKSAPLQIGIPIQANHAILMYKISQDNYGAFDHYESFLRTNDAKDKPINFAFKGYVSIVEPPKPQEKPKYNFTKILIYGDKSNDVRALQDILKYEGHMSSKVLSTGNFLDITAMALKKWQVAHGLMDFANETNLKKIRFGEKSIKVVNNIYN